MKLFSANKPTEYRIGTFLGAALRKTTAEAAAIDSDKTVCPHIRRTHFHYYWVGLKGSNELIVKWLPPIPVKFDPKGDEKITQVIKHVTKKVG